MTDTPNYTPGPWRTHPYDWRQICQEGKNNRVGQGVAYVEYAGRKHEAAEANAALIAAAPDMLEALIPLQAYAANESALLAIRGLEHSAAYLRELADKARSAIDRATAANTAK